MHTQKISTLLSGPYRRGVLGGGAAPPQVHYITQYSENFDLIRKFLGSYEVLRSDEIDSGNVIEKWAKQRARRM